MSHIIALMGIVDRGDQENPGNLDHGSDIFIEKKRKRTKGLSKGAASRRHCEAWVRAWVTVWRTGVGVSTHTQSPTWSSVSPHYSSSIHTVRSYVPQMQPRI